MPDSCPTGVIRTVWLGPESSFRDGRETVGLIGKWELGVLGGDADQGKDEAGQSGELPLSVIDFWSRSAYTLRH